MGFVLVHLILLRLNRTHTRRLGLRAANLNYPVGVLSVCVYCRRLFSFSLFVFGVCLSSLLLLSPLSAVRPVTRPHVSLSLSLSLFLSRLSCPRVCRHALILICSDHVQLGPPVDLCVRELSLPLSNVIRRLWAAW